MSLNLKETFLGIEFGSTRIKAVLIDKDHQVLATGSHEWENRLENGYWTYALEAVWAGLKDCYADLKQAVRAKFDTELTTFGGIGFSAMMHGYLAFNKEGRLLVPFRTWRNTTAHEAAAKLTEYLNFNIPDRWSIAHLYQCVLDKEEHLQEIDYITTLSGYIHWQLTGEKVLGIGDAAGMFPIDSTICDFDQDKLALLDKLTAEAGYSWHAKDLLPKVMVAGEKAGVLTADGAKALDPEGILQPGIPLCAPEGDAGTGMVATNTVKQRTGNISAGTSVFAMVVLEKALAKLHREIDMVTTPDGSPVAMSHANNCTSDLNAWVGIFREFAEAAGIKMDTTQLFSVLYNKALEGDADCGGLLSYGYFSGEFITGLEEGRPLFVRKENANFNLANFMRSHLFTALGAVKIGLDILIKDEGVKLDVLLGHGGLFKTKGVGQAILAGAVNVPVSVMETAGEGGPWGMAILAAFMVNGGGESLPDYLQQHVFANAAGSTLSPKAEDVAGYEKFIELYKQGLPVEQSAVDHLR